jgi:threonine dehydrogenase-like Zn-dependent dehydrogenase
MIEPVSIAFHAVNRTPIRLGDTALVVGCGVIGLLVVQALKQAGCGRIIAMDLDDQKLELAGKLGAGDTLNPSRGNGPENILDLTGGVGVDVAVEAVGATEPLETAIASLRKGGTLTMVGNVTPKVELPLQSIVTRELTLAGSCASCGEYPACIALMADGRIDVDPLISATAPLDEGGSWFDRLHKREPGLVKVILTP